MPADLSPSTVTGYRSNRRVVCHPDHGIGDKLATELTHANLFEWRNVAMKDAGVTKHAARCLPLPIVGLIARSGTRQHSDEPGAR